METRVPRSVFREMISSAITPVTATARGSVYQDGEEITAIKQFARDVTPRTDLALSLTIANVNLDGKVQTARSVKCTLDAFMVLVTSHGNVIVLTAGADFFAIEIWNIAPDENLVRMGLRAQILVRGGIPVPAKTATLDKTVTKK